MNFLKKNIANIITTLRIVGTIVLLFEEALTKSFFIVYILTAVTDVFDGLLARSLHIESDIGRKLDSVADILFYTVSLIKVWSYLLLYLPKAVWALIWSIVAVRLILYAYTFIAKKMLMSNHTILNKVTGILLFFVPFFLKTDFFVAFAWVVTSIAVLAAIYEIVLVIQNKQVIHINKTDINNK